jgi:hypothetical protein
MGAEEFYTPWQGTSPADAFAGAVEQAQYDHGHSGYSGTIAEKNQYVLITIPEGKDPRDYAQQLMNDNDPRIGDKWGPAGCIDMGPSKIHKGKNVYLFFGVASS